MSKQPSNQILEVLIKGVDSKVKEIKTTVIEIVNQVKITNGRVTTIEEWKKNAVKEIEDLSTKSTNMISWKGYITGGLTVLSIIFAGIIIPIVYKALTE